MKRSSWTLFDGWPKPTHWHSQVCCRRLFKIRTFNSDPKWPQDDLRSKILFLNTPKGPLPKDLFTPVSSKSIESCSRRSVLSIFEQWLQMIPRWPLTPNFWTPLLFPHLMITVSKYYDDQRTFEKKHFLIVNWYTDPQIDRHFGMP